MPDQSNKQVGSAGHVDMVALHLIMPDQFLQSVSGARVDSEQMTTAACVALFYRSTGPNNRRSQDGSAMLTKMGVTLERMTVRAASAGLSMQR
jgi:hypothetical protein